MMEGLGRVVNVVPIAQGTLISLKDCAGVTFVCTGDDTFTLASAACGAAASLDGTGTFTECSSVTAGAAETAGVAGTAAFPQAANTRARHASAPNIPNRLVIQSLRCAPGAH